MKLKLVILAIFILYFTLLASNTIIDTLYSIPYLDGDITYDWDTHTFFYNTGDTFFTCGDYGFINFATSRGYLSFDLPDTPEGYEILHAEIFVHQYFSVGNGVSGQFPIWDIIPLPDTTGCIVDHINYGNQLTPDDWTAGDPGDPQTLNSNIGVISDNAIDEFKNLEVTSSIQEDYDTGRDKTQYRLRFMVNNDWDQYGDGLRFTSGNGYLYECPFIVYTWWDGVNSADNYELSNTNKILNVYPNPFNSSTTISYQLSCDQNEQIMLEIYNIKGQKVDTLIPSLCQPAAADRGEVIWNAEDQTSGIYIIKISNLKEKYVKKITYLK